MKKQIRTDEIVNVRKYPTVTFSPRGSAATPSFFAPEFCIFTRRGLWQLLFFLLISVAAFAGQDFDLFAVIPEDLWPLFGSPPPQQLIHLVLAVYTFCALMLLPARLHRSSLAQSWAHLGYRTIFYLFYLSANALAAHFMMVFVAGLLLYVLEQFYLWLHLNALHGVDARIRHCK